MTNRYPTPNMHPKTDHLPHGHNKKIMKPWEHAINRALSGVGKKGQCTRAAQLLLIAEEVIKSAQDRKDPNFRFAVQEIGLRLDGKPTEHIEVGLDKDSTSLAIGISQTLRRLSELTGRGTLINGEVIVQDRPLLPSKVRTEEERH